MKAPVIPADPVEAFRLFLRVAGRPANKHTGEPRGNPTRPRIYEAMLRDNAWRAWLGIPEFVEPETCGYCDGRGFYFNDKSWEPDYRGELPGFHNYGFSVCSCDLGREEWWHDVTTHPEYQARVTRKGRDA